MSFGSLLKRRAVTRKSPRKAKVWYKQWCMHVYRNRRYEEEIVMLMWHREANVLIIDAHVVTRMCYWFVAKPHTNEKAYQNRAEKRFLRVVCLFRPIRVTVTYVLFQVSSHSHVCFIPSFESQSRTFYSKFRVTVTYVLFQVSSHSHVRFIPSFESQSRMFTSSFDMSKDQKLPTCAIVHTHSNSPRMLRLG